MSLQNTREITKSQVLQRKSLHQELPQSSQGKILKVSQYFGQNVFQLKNNRNFSADTQKEIISVLEGTKALDKSLAKQIADVVLNWALEKGATHFCHWFQPLTGSTAEKHDAFLTFKGDRPIEKLSASQLMQGEPDASSFPNGGSRSTFEARGYTCWDLTSPIFIKENTNGKTLCIPTAFISYHGDALDIKTPLLRSMSSLSEAATTFLNLIGVKDAKSVTASCGCEQEYFLVDKAFYYQREDLVMSGRTLVGSLTPKNQQLSDHYFGTIPERVLSYMQDCEIELYKLGIPAKTRHNEVAPGQFEIAPIFSDANTAADNNQLLMATLKTVAQKHDFVCLFHEKPFADINGSGKHLNWSLSDNNGTNLLEPGSTPHENYRFLAMVAIVCEAVKRHAVSLRAAIGSHSNDHRLGGHEAPPSIISVFLGATVKSILDKYLTGDNYSPEEQIMINTGAGQLAQFLQDNTDRNRTSPFAFTGNKFEFRAVGSSANVGFPLTVLNAAVIDVMKETNIFIKEKLDSGLDVTSVLKEITKKWYVSSHNVVFNGDGYSEAWVKEAESRGLPNLKTTVDALIEFNKSENHKHLFDLGVYRPTEFESLYNVNLEKYNTCRNIELRTQKKMIDRTIKPCVYQYKKELAQLIKDLKELGSSYSSEEKTLNKVSSLLDELTSVCEKLSPYLSTQNETEEKRGIDFANVGLDLSERVITLAGELEDIIPDSNWTIPTYFDLLFIR